MTVESLAPQPHDRRNSLRTCDSRGNSWCDRTRQWASATSGLGTLASIIHLQQWRTAKAHKRCGQAKKRRLRGPLEGARGPDLGFAMSCLGLRPLSCELPSRDEPVHGGDELGRGRDRELGPGVGTAQGGEVGRPVALEGPSRPFTRD